MNSFEFALLPTDPLEQVAGQYLQPELRATTDFSWTYNDFQVGLFNRYLGKHDQQEDFAGFNGQPGARISAHSEWDLRFVFTGLEMFTFTAGIENFTNEGIPLDWFATEGYDPALYNDRGRFVYTQLGFRF